MVIKTVFIVVIIFIALDLNIENVNSSDFECSKDSKDYKCKLSAKTPYRFFANHNDDEVIIPGCEAKKIWLMVRHGTRLPASDFLEKTKDLPRLKEQILNHCSMGKCSLTEMQLEKLRNWKLEIWKGEKLLTEEGEDEMIGLGERFQSRFPNLMPERFDNKTFKFKSTVPQRAVESARHFTIGLFGKKGSRNVWYPKPEKEDPILRFYKGCERWKQDVKNNPKAQEHIRMFGRSSVVQEMVVNVSKRLGIDVNFESIQVIRGMCAFEIAWSKENFSPWCDLLTVDDFKIVEFHDDLNYYWIDGYGFPLTYLQACSALTDMFDFFNSTDNELKTSAYFTHSGTLLKVLSLLEIGKEEILLSHDSFATSDDRNWRTSIIDPFGTNIAFVSYECTTGSAILVMHQERYVNLPGCPVDLPCPLPTMRNKFPDTAEECPFEQMCSLKKN